MKINVILLLLLCVFPSVLCAEDWVVAGKTYKNVTVGRIEDDRVHITYDGGIGAIPLADLPPDLRKKFGYDPAKATVAQAVEAQREAASDLAAQAEAEKEKAIADQSAVAAATPKTSYFIGGSVIQITPEGILVQCPDATGLAMSGNARLFIEAAQKRGGVLATGLCFVKNYSKQGTLVDGDKVQILAYPDGIYSYPATDGATSTVHSYLAQ